MIHGFIFFLKVARFPIVFNVCNVTFLGHLIVLLRAVKYDSIWSERTMPEFPRLLSQIIFCFIENFSLRWNTFTIPTTCIFEMVRTSRLSFHLYTVTGPFCCQIYSPFFSFLLFRRIPDTYIRFLCILYMHYQNSPQISVRQK